MKTNCQEKYCATQPKQENIPIVTTLNGARILTPQAPRTAAMQGFTRLSGVAGETDAIL